MKPLRDALRREAGRVWREKARAGALGLFLNEETITESTLLNLATAFCGHGLFVRIFTKAEERRNGADWEFWFVQGRRATGLRVQAKRLFPGGAYSSLNSSGPQTTTLINNAGNCCPVYVFYNDAGAYRSSLPRCSCGEYRARSYLGCTLAPAVAVAHAGRNVASSLQEITIPWHCLLCESTAKRTSLPDVIAKNLNKYAAQPDHHQCEVVETPRQFQPYTGAEFDPGPELTRSGGYEEPGWLEEYLSEKTLAGIALVGSTGG
jgi:hypothetical protein